jgi:hypothetical protein
MKTQKEVTKKEEVKKEVVLSKIQQATQSCVKQGIDTCYINATIRNFNKMSDENIEKAYILACEVIKREKLTLDNVVQVMQEKFDKVKEVQGVKVDASGKDIKNSTRLFASLLHIESNKTRSTSSLNQDLRAFFITSLNATLKAFPHFDKSVCHIIELARTEGSRVASKKVLMTTNK